MKKGFIISLASVAFIITFLLTTGEQQQAHSFSSQPPAFNASAPGQGSCGADTGGCHGTYSLNEGMGSTIIEFDTGNTTYQAGETYTMNVTITQTGAMRFGFQLVALDAMDNNAGSFIVTNSINTATQSSAGIEFINHLNAPIATDTYTFTFDWTAPATGTGDVVFYVSGNAANGSGSSGDYIYGNQRTITEQAVTVSSDYALSAKVFLEAMYDGTSQNTNRIEDGLLPAMQPFATYFGYNGTENVNSFATDATDWILLALKDVSENVVAQQACILSADGTITDVDGNTVITFDGIADTETLTLAVYHQSHLAIASSSALASGANHDFTTSEAQATGFQQLKMVNGAYAMYSGDYDGNGNINNLDFNLWASNNAAVNQYLTHDADGNGIVNNLDYNSWELNRSKVADPLTQ